MVISRKAVEEIAQSRGSEFLNAVLSAGKVEGDRIEIEDRKFMRFLELFPRQPEPPLPSLPIQAANLAGSLLRNAASVIKGTPLIVPEEVEKKRLSTCQSCPFYRTSDQRCGKCGCYLGGEILSKVKYSAEFCYDKPPRWGAWKAV